MSGTAGEPEDSTSSPAGPTPATTAAPRADSSLVPDDLQAVGGGRRRARVFAHRGSSGLFAEHTRAAYRRALDEGADGLEIDVHLSRDGEVVCFHDATVDRTSDGSGAVADLTLAELRGLDVHSWKTPHLPAEYGAGPEQLMTLHDTMELLADAGRDVRLAVELKHPSPYGHQLEERVLQVLFRHGWDPETSTLPGRPPTPGAPTPRIVVSFMSFYPAALRHLAEMVPTERLCALFNDVTARQITHRVEHLKFWAFAARPVVSAVMRGASRDAEALVWNARVGIAGPGLRTVRRRRAEVKAWLARGTTLRVWTVDDPADAQFLLDLGVGEMTTNRPARIIEAVTAPQTPDRRRG